MTISGLTTPQKTATSCYETQFTNCARRRAGVLRWQEIVMEMIAIVKAIIRLAYQR